MIYPNPIDKDEFNRFRDILYRFVKHSDVLFILCALEVTNIFINKFKGM